MIDQVGPNDWECIVLDFADAFKQLHVHPDEVKHLGGRASGGYFCYKNVLFGIKSGPLVWGRVAALFIKLTAALHHGQRARIQCFVDDPAVTIGGPQPTRDRLLARTVLLWLAFGGKLSWRKGARGREIEWTRALVKPWVSPTAVHGVELPLQRRESAN